MPFDRIAGLAKIPIVAPRPTPPRPATAPAATADRLWAFAQVHL